MRTLTFAIPLAFLLALAGAQAHHCTTWTTSVSNEDTLIIDLGTDFILGRYVVNDLCQAQVSPEPGVISVWFGHEFARVPVPVTVESDCIFSVWNYYETNGIPGLQRGDEVRDDTCHWMIEADIFLW